MGLFANTIIDGLPICPYCNEACEPDNSNVVGTNSTGTWIMHPICLLTHNEEIKNG